MFDKLREKWRKQRENKARWNEAFTEIKSGSAESVKKVFDGWAQDKIFKLTTDNKGDLLKAAIDRQDAAIFREVLICADDPNATITYSTYSNNTQYNHSYSPIYYAIEKKGTHDISLTLASNPRVTITDGLLESARNSGMQDVAAVLATRIAELRRQEAQQLDQEAAAANGTAPAVTPAPAAPEKIPANDKGDAAIAAPNAPTDEWALMSEKSVAHVTASPVIGRKLTEIFNFENRERVIISENLKTGAETIGAGEAFDKLSPDTVKRAEEKLRQLTAESAKKTFNL